jgi:hypothetical protein
VGAGVRVRRLVGDEQLDGLAEDRVRELARGGERLEVVAEVAPEEVVDRREHLRARAVVAGEHEPAALRLAPLAEHLDVGVTEAVDRLELVADDEDVPQHGPGRRSAASGVRRRRSWAPPGGSLSRPGAGEEVDQVALESVRVLELVHHDRAEAERLLVADLRMLAKEVPREELEVLEVERGLAALGCGVGVGEAVQELLNEVAVPHRELVERRVLCGDSGLLVARGPLAACAVRLQVEQVVGPRVGRDELEQRGCVGALEVGRRAVVEEAARRGLQLLEPRGER